MKELTYEGWRAIGYQVMKGQKATYVNGVATFSEAQVKESKTFDWSDEERESMGLRKRK